MDDIEKTVTDLIEAFEANDDKYAKIALTQLGVGVLRDIRRIADALTLVANCVAADCQVVDLDTYKRDIVMAQDKG